MKISSSSRPNASLKIREFKIDSSLKTFSSSFKTSRNNEQSTFSPSSFMGVSARLYTSQTNRDIKKVAEVTTEPGDSSVSKFKRSFVIKKIDGTKNKAFAFDPQSIKKKIIKKITMNRNTVSGYSESTKEFKNMNQILDLQTDPAFKSVYTPAYFTDSTPFSYFDDFTYRFDNYNVKIPSLLIGEK
jgi:hypothetical protein